MQTEGGLVNMLKLFNSASHHVVCDGIIRRKSEASPDKNAQFHPIVWNTCPPAADSLHSQVTDQDAGMHWKVIMSWEDYCTSQRITFISLEGVPFCSTCPMTDSNQRRPRVPV